MNTITRTARLASLTAAAAVTLMLFDGVVALAPAERAAVLAQSQHAAPAERTAKAATLHVQAQVQVAKAAI